MSAELERRLRAGRESLPEPDPASTGRARERALTPIRRRGTSRARAAVAVAVLVAALAGVGLADATFSREPLTLSQTPPSRVIDRTFVCTQSPYGGFPEIEARAHAGIRGGREAWKQLPYAAVGSGPYATFAWITAGAPTRDTVVEIDLVRRKKPSGTAAINLQACRSDPARVPLSAAGLSGGGASPFGDEFDCGSGPRFRVRVRAVLTRRASLGARRTPSPGSRAKRPFLITNVPVREAQMAVRTLTNRPLVYAEVAESGRTRLFTANGCVRE